MNLFIDIITLCNRLYVVFFYLFQFLFASVNCFMSKTFFSFNFCFCELFYLFIVVLS